MNLEFGGMLFCQGESEGPFASTKIDRRHTRYFDVCGGDIQIGKKFNTMETATLVELCYVFDPDVAFYLTPKLLAPLPPLSSEAIDDKSASSRQKPQSFAHGR